MLSRLEIYGVVCLILLALVGGTYFYVTHLQAKVARLEDKVAGLELKADVIEKAQKKTDEYVKARDQRVKKNVQDNANIDKVVESGDDPAMHQLFIDRGLLGPKAGSPAGGTQGRPGNIPARPSGVHPLN